MRKAVAVAFLLVFLALPLAEATLSIGYSDYDAHVSVGLDGKTFSVGKITNNGNVTLTYSLRWIQADSTVKMVLPVRGNNFTLAPGQSFEPSVTVEQVNSSYVGNYAGVMQLEGGLEQTGESGMSFVPTGQFHVAVQIIDSKAKKPENFWLFLTLAGGLIAAAVISGTVTVFLIRHRKQKHDVVFR